MRLLKAGSDPHATAKVRCYQFVKTISVTENEVNLCLKIFVSFSQQLTFLSFFSFFSRTVLQSSIYAQEKIR